MLTSGACHFEGSKEVSRNSSLFLVFREEKATYPRGRRGDLVEQE